MSPPRFFSAACVDKTSDLPRGYDQGHLVEHSCPPLETNVPDNLAVNGTRDAVLQLEVHLGDGVLGEDRGVRDVTWKEKECQRESAETVREAEARVGV